MADAPPSPAPDVPATVPGARRHAARAGRRRTHLRAEAVRLRAELARRALARAHCHELVRDRRARSRRRRAAAESTQRRHIDRARTHGSPRARAPAGAHVCLVAAARELLAADGARRRGLRASQPFRRRLLVRRGDGRHDQERRHGAIRAHDRRGRSGAELHVGLDAARRGREAQGERLGVRDPQRRR